MSEPVISDVATGQSQGPLSPLGDLRSTEYYKVLCSTRVAMCTTNQTRLLRNYWSISPALAIAWANPAGAREPYSHLRFRKFRLSMATKTIVEKPSK